MGRVRSVAAAALLLVSLGPSASQLAASAENEAPAHKSAYGKLARVDEKLGGIIMTSDEGKRIAWKFDKRVIAELARFKPGDPIIVIYRQRGSDKAVTAVAFPGASATPIYVNTTGERVEFVSGPMVDGICGPAADAPATRTTVPAGGMAEVSDACWCCAPEGETCTPANKTGLGQAFLTRCYE